MELVKPSVYLISRPQVDWTVLVNYLAEEVGVSYDWSRDRVNDPGGEVLIEFMARLCYRSFEPGLNANVTKIRDNPADYFENILKSRHGSVLAHAHYSFVFHNVSRVFTHEIVRHSTGTDISQESLRYVRLDHIKFWMPEWVYDEGGELLARSTDIIRLLEDHQRWLADRFRLDDPNTNFNEKKSKTSFMRRFAPEGLATTVGMTFNVRAIRHVLEMRYSEHAEEEMRVVMPLLFGEMKAELPLLFNDYTINGENLETSYRKV
jgi:thymidylate synthase (FAD)